MRYIDADARVTVQSYDPMNEEYSHDEMSVADALDFATDEGCPPTIDAIPVEWLKQWRDKLNGMGEYQRECAEDISFVLRLWQKEQEAR